MLVDSGSIVVYGRCPQLLNAVLGEGMGKVLKVLRLEGDKLVAHIPGEAKDRIVELRACIERDERGGKLIALNELGLQAVIMSVSCREEGLKAVANYELVLNPTALGISTRLAKLALVHVKHGFVDRLLSFIRATPIPCPELRSELLREDFVARVMARARILEKLEVDPSRTSITELCAKHPRNSLFVVVKDGGLALRMVVIGGLYAAHLRLGELEYVDDRALEKLRTWSGRASATLYSIDELIPPKYR